MPNPFQYFIDGSIKRSIMASFIFVLLLPIGFFIYSLSENSWEQAQQNMLQKHELIALAMVEPISLFITSRQHALQALGDEIFAIEKEMKLAKNKASNKQQSPRIQIALDKYQKSYGDLIAISYTPNLNISQISIKEEYSSTSSSNKPDYLNLPLTKLSTIDEQKQSIDLISPIFQSSISKQPAVLLKHYISNSEGKIKSALLSEISPTYVTDMCSKINFGDKGHCAIVDQTGHVVAHPNKSWIKEIRDISKTSIVQKMLDGKSGTTEFYSPFLKGDMVAGFSSIPKLGWGIMVPQPKIELTRTLDSLRKNIIIWLLLGIIIALVVAFLLTQKITAPISVLMKRAHEASAGYDFINLGAIPKNSPREINQLWNSISLLLTGLQKSNKEVKKLNVSLNRDIDRATIKLQSMNKHLYDLSNKDYLTSLANRRYFTSYLNKAINQKNKENIGLILIDIDKFKFINDEYGHEAGDLALKHLSKTLQKITRKGDLVSRLGGDEFVVYIKDATDQTLDMIAEKIRLTTEEEPTIVKDIKINITLSMGTVNHDNDENLTVEDFLRFADSAMYTSKKTGRNNVSSYTFKKVNTKPELVS
jgi:diguanylate cyclase (GGDEF)-like protein